MKKTFLSVGQIVGVHGVRGFVRVQYWCDSAEFFCSFKNLYNESKQLLNVEKTQPHGNVALLKLKDINSATMAECLRGKVLYIKREDAQLEEGRYFIEELIGVCVKDTKGTDLGKIVDVSKTGANDVWHIKTGEREHLFPVVPHFVVSVDIDGEIVVINPPKGIFDDED